MIRSTVRRTVAVAAAGTLALTVVGCAQQTTQNTAEVDAAGLEASQQELAAFSAPQEFVIPEDITPVDANAASGASVYIINTSDQLPGAIKWIEGIERALEPYGVTVVRFDGKGTPTEYNKGIQQAIAQGADVIYNLAIAPEFVKESLEDAEAAGIPVISATDGRPALEDITNPLPGLVAEVSVDYAKIGSLQADWFIAESEGKGNALYISNLDQPSSTFMVEAFTQRVTENCPACTVATEDVPAVQVAQRVPTLVQTQLRANPNINFVVPGFDFQVPLIVSALEQAGLSDTVKIGSWDASGPVLNLMKDDESPVYMDMSAPYNWNSYASADTIFRVLAGEEPYVWGTETSNYLGIRMFSKDDVADWEITGFDDARNFDLPDDVVEEAFQELWGAPQG